MIKCCFAQDKIDSFTLSDIDWEIYAGLLMLESMPLQKCHVVLVWYLCGTPVVHVSTT